MTRDDPASRRFERCSECGTRLPLLRPTPEEPGETWACAFCGNLYRAVLDAACSEDYRMNVRRFER